MKKNKIYKIQFKIYNRFLILKQMYEDSNEKQINLEIRF